jgi:hypothetical protein
MLSLSLSPRGGSAGRTNQPEFERYEEDEDEEDAS